MVRTPAPRAASTTDLIIGRAQTSCRTLARPDLIRLPCPAARMIATGPSIMGTFPAFVEERGRCGLTSRERTRMIRTGDRAGQTGPGRAGRRRRTLNGPAESGTLAAVPRRSRPSLLGPCRQPPGCDMRRVPVREGESVPMSSLTVDQVAKVALLARLRLG